MTISKQALVDAAQALQRRVYATLPWGYRVAAFLFELRYASDPEAFGRLAYGVFLMNGVTGLPEAPFVPTNAKEIDKLPRGYGQEFGIAARNLARRFFADEDRVDELLASLSVALLSNATLHRGIARKPLGEARSYVFGMVANLARDMLRSQKVRRHEVLDDVIADPSSWASLANLIPESEQESIQEELGNP